MTVPRGPLPELLSFRLAFTLLICFVAIALVTIAIHWQLLRLPYFWDEHGQFIPTALDLLRTGSWVAHSTLPNVHPPGVEAYLVFWYRLFGYSILVTRIAMLLLAAAGVLLTFLLAIELSKGAPGAPAFLPPLLLLVSPLFYMQSMLAQLDMPAMVLTSLALLLFISNHYFAAAVASMALVLCKETGIVLPLILGIFCLYGKQIRRAAYFLLPALSLTGWLLVLHRTTGYWLGNPEFAHYNVQYSLNPVRIAFSFVRRLYYLFFAEFRFVGTAALLWCLFKNRWQDFRSRNWLIAASASLLCVLVVSVLGGAELERYLLPVLPILYIAMSIAFVRLPRRVSAPAIAITVGGLIANIFWNPPYPFPFENNYALVDFVRLQQIAANFAQQELPQARIATAWPYTPALTQPDYGFVRRPLRTVETTDFHLRSIENLSPDSFDALVVYTRTWMPAGGAISIPGVRRFLEKFYDWAPDVTDADCERLGLERVAAWSSGGQRIIVYVRPKKTA